MPSLLLLPQLLLPMLLFLPPVPTVCATAALLAATAAATHRCNRSLPPLPLLAPLLFVPLLLLQVAPLQPHAAPLNRHRRPQSRTMLLGVL